MICLCVESPELEDAMLGLNQMGEHLRKKITGLKETELALKKQKRLLG